MSDLIFSVKHPQQTNNMNIKDNLIRLTDAQNFDDFFKILNEAIVQFGTKEVADTLGISYGVTRLAEREQKMSRNTLKNISISLVNSDIKTVDVFTHLCAIFNIDEPNEYELASLKREIKMRASAQERRPQYMIPGSRTVVTYSQEEESRDIYYVEEARKEPESGLEDALVKYWWLQQVLFGKELNYSREEAIKFEAMSRIKEINQAIDPQALRESIEYFDGSLFGFLSSSWTHNQDKCPVTFDEKVSGAGITRQQYVDLVKENIIRIAKSIAKEIEERHETQECEQKFVSFKQCLFMIHVEWDVAEFDLTSVYSLVKKSMLYEAERLACAVFEAQSDFEKAQKEETLGQLSRIMIICDAWDIPLESVGLNPKRMTLCLIKASLSGTMEEYPALFKKESIRTELSIMLQ